MMTEVINGILLLALMHFHQLQRVFKMYRMDIIPLAQIQPDLTMSLMDIVHFTQILAGILM